MFTITINIDNMFLSKCDEVIYMSESKKDYEKIFQPFNDKTKKILEKIRSEVNEDSILKKLDEEYDVDEMLMFNEFNIKEKTEFNPFYQKQFRMLYLSEQNKLERLKERLLKETGEKYQLLKNGEVSLTKAEIEKYYLAADVDLIRVRGAILKMETRVRFFELVLKAFESQQWNIKNWHEASKGGW